MNKALPSTTLSLLFFWLFLSPIHAQTTVFTENFSQDFSKWQTTRDTGELWKIIDGQAEVFVDHEYTITELVPKDEYWNQGWQNISYELDYTPLAGIDKNLTFGFQNLDHWYEIHFVQDFFNMVKVKNGQRPFDVNLPYAMQNGQTYHLQILFHTGLIEVFVDQQLIAQEYDATFQDDYGKIGLKVSTGTAFPTHIRLDNIVVQQILSDGFKLEVPLVEQNHPSWDEVLYDTANQWSSQPTIGRWGCALSSMIMILKYYQIHSFPDGTEITPITLNTWLQEQADGYVGEGLVNWLAITRLTEMISQKFATPKLEFEAITEDPWKAAMTELQTQRPVILNMPGHFMTGIGITGNKQDIYINDPYFDQITFLQHQQTLQSIRKFVPSYTDLSYLLIVHSPNLFFKMTVEGQDLEKPSTLTEFITSPGAQTTTATYVLNYWRKPTSGKYQLSFSLYPPVSTPQKTQIQIFAYDQTGNVTDFSWNGFIEAQPLQFEVEYQKTQSSVIRPVMTWEKFHQTLIDLINRAQIKRFSSYYHLREVIDWATPSSLVSQKRYTLLFESRLTTRAHTMTPAAQDVLVSQLSLLQTYLDLKPP